MKFRFKPFQARLVACWLVAMPMTWLLVTQDQHKVARLKANPMAEIAKELKDAEKLSFVGMFWVLLIALVLLTFLIEFIAKLLRSMTIDTTSDPVEDA
jgi:Na+-driven multidrug efflux pump